MRRFKILTIALAVSAAGPSFAGPPHEAGQHHETQHHETKSEGGASHTASGQAVPSAADKTAAAGVAPGAANGQVRDVVRSDVSNAGTWGFKASEVHFADVYAGLATAEPSPRATER